MTTIIISTAHIGAWILMMLCVIATFIIMENKESTSEKPSSVTTLAILMMIISIVLIGRDWDHKASIVLYGMDGLIAITGSLIMYSKNRSTIKTSSATMFIAIVLVLVWHLIGNLIVDFGH